MFSVACTDGALSVYILDFRDTVVFSYNYNVLFALEAEHNLFYGFFFISAWIFLILFTCCLFTDKHVASLIPTPKLSAVTSSPLEKVEVEFYKNLTLCLSN